MSPDDIQFFSNPTNIYKMVRSQKANFQDQGHYLSK